MPKIELPIDLYDFELKRVYDEINRRMARVVGVQLPEGMGPVVGQEALRASWDAFAAMEDFDVSWEPTAAFVSPDGNMAYDYGTTSATTPDGTVPGKYLVVWVKVDGEWKVAADIFNSSVAPQ